MKNTHAISMGILLVKIYYLFNSNFITFNIAHAEFALSDAL